MKKALRKLALAALALASPLAGAQATWHGPEGTNRQALQWEFNRPGRTWVIGSNRACEGEFCVGFTYVVCADPAR